jgi:hypothetical protein
MSYSVALSSGAASLAGLGVNARELLRKEPTANSASAKQGELLQALDRYVTRQTPDNPITKFEQGQVNPDDINLKTLLFDSDKLAHYQRATPTQSPGFTVNPNADAGLLAHELGHVAFGQSPLGARVQRMRDTSPRLTSALTAASALAPMAIAAGTSGEDNDLAAGLAVTGLLSAPELIDEFEGTRRGLAIMKESGTAANLGQRARMAGGLLSYAARPIAYAAAGAVGGNLIRSQFAEEPRSTGEIQPY